MTKSYSEMLTLKTFNERFEYLRIRGFVGHETHGHLRYLNQKLYKSNEWNRVRREVIIRDDGCDLAIPDRQIHGKIVIHHINPITIEDLQTWSRIIFDLDNLVCVSYDTHEAIHYGTEDLFREYEERRPNDTCPWKE